MAPKMPTPPPDLTVEELDTWQRYVLTRWVEDERRRAELASDNRNRERSRRSSRIDPTRTRMQRRTDEGRAEILDELAAVDWQAVRAELPEVDLDELLADEARA